MFRYIIRRILFFVPVLLGVSLIIFFLSKNQPDDPVAKICTKDGVESRDSLNRARVAKRLYLDKPVFYFSLTTQAYPKNLYQVNDKRRRSTLKKLYHQANSPELVKAYDNALNNFIRKVENAKGKATTVKLYSNLKSRSQQLLYEYQYDKVTNKIKHLKNKFGDQTALPLYALLEDVEAKFTAIYHHQNHAKKYMPVFHWYGFDNQYQIWMSKLLRFDFGESYDGGFVAQKIESHIFWTVVISSIAIVLAYVIAITLGVVAGVNKDTRLDRRISTTLYALYSLPYFWGAILLLTFFANTSYFEWFPSHNTSSPSPEYPFWDHVHHLILPIICWTYPSLAVLAQHMRNGMIGVLQEDYIRTARAKGLPENRIIWKHAIKNALLPIITMLGNILPRLIGGSVILEVIFGIEGMGKLLYDSIDHNDFPTIFAIVMMVAVLTVIGYLVSDILYKIIDPRVKF